MEIKTDLPTLLKNAETFHSRISLIAADHKTKKQLLATFKDKRIVEELWKAIKVLKSLRNPAPFIPLKTTTGEVGFFGWYNHEYRYLYGNISQPALVELITAQLFKE